ncbi:MAG TPA: efflux transporter outer membrane subunit [Steroidobacteraceae bacterium]|jgi:NodT family efflux transporter outer membrane factor (OMF) lipoprotein|nr:efflux transporter outer membrane subunit [Steroidobacteraceae bacterium]
MKRGSMLLVMAAAVATLLAGCVLPPKESAREPQIDAQRLGLMAAAVSPADQQWWKAFHDPQLDTLIEQALASNPSLAQASAQLRAAVAQVDAAHAGLLPRASFSGSALRQHAPENYIIPPPLAGGDFWMAQIGASLSWDLDFWGRQADAVTAARALAQVADLERDNTRLLLAAALVQAYVGLYRADALADVATQAESQRQHILDLTRQRVTAGLDTRLELREAESELPQARVERAQALAQADLAVHALSMLAGHGADRYAAITRPQLDPDVGLPLPEQLPINLLARRPDVLAARLRIEAADADRRATRAAFYPDVSLRALAGIASFGLNDLFEAGARGYGVGPAVSLPLFDAGKLRAQYQGREAAIDGAVAVYNDTVLRAVQQSADELTRIEALIRERSDQQATLIAAEDGYRIAEERYRAGLAGYLSVLSAETQVLSARRQKVQITSDLALARVNLLLELGGSFEPDSHLARN